MAVLGRSCIFVEAFAGARWFTIPVIMQNAHAGSPTASTGKQYIRRQVGLFRDMGIELLLLERAGGIGYVEHIGADLIAPLRGCLS